MRQADRLARDAHVRGTARVGRVIDVAILFLSIAESATGNLRYLLFSMLDMKKAARAASLLAPDQEDCFAVVQQQSYGRILSELKIMQMRVPGAGCGGGVTVSIQRGRWVVEVAKGDSVVAKLVLNTKPMALAAAALYRRHAVLVPLP